MIPHSELSYMARIKARQEASHPGTAADVEETLELGTERKRTLKRDAAVRLSYVQPESHLAAQLDGNWLSFRVLSMGSQRGEGKNLRESGRKEVSG